MEAVMAQKRILTTFFAAALLGIGWSAAAQTTSTSGTSTKSAGGEETERLVQNFTLLAGSESNAKTLISGLRDGKDFKLSGTTFDPPIKKMGYGEIDIALSLAEAELKQQGITNPTAAQLQAALIGDSAHPGILQLRAAGKGWGQIASSLGFKLGDVVRSEKSQGRDALARGERLERPAKPERPEKPERPQRPDRAERPGR
jgi:hypothetical protein